MIVQKTRAARGGCGRTRGNRLSSRILFASLAALAVSGMAAAEEAAPSAYEGRWVSEKASLTLDVSRCGDGYCGVEVTNGSTCGRVILRAAAKKGTGREQVVGRLEFAPGTQSYAVALNVVAARDGAPEKLFIAGHTGDEFQPFRRTFSYHNLFVRAGDAVCKSPTS